MTWKFDGGREKQICWFVGRGGLKQERAYAAI
jgi:hypothetical protein